MNVQNRLKESFTSLELPTNIRSFKSLCDFHTNEICKEVTDILYIATLTTWAMRPIKLAQAVMFLTCILEVPGSSLGEIFTILIEARLDFPHYLTENAGMIPQIRPRPFSPTSFPIFTTIIRRKMAWAVISNIPVMIMVNWSRRFPKSNVAYDNLFRYQ
jgi:hypothetical protein